MAHAFPKGELLPRSCVGAHFDLVKLPVVTLVDAVDTLAILGNRSEFQGAVRRITEVLPDFDVDVNVSVFETNIRVLGGLLSAHLFATDERLDLMEPHGDLATGGYDDELLKLAVDLGWRLLPAFDTATGIPYGTVNLAYGVPRGETTVSSLAGAGSLSLEFSVLSALSGNPDFGRKARASARALYDRRSVLGLLGKHINIRSGKWVEALSGIGSNSDSFYEYLLKVYLVFGDVDHWDMFLETYARIGDHVRQGDWYADVDMFAGKPRRQHFENLQAFWPGLQVLAGDVALAARSLNAFWGVWADWGVLPEEYDYGTSHLVATTSALRYPLRPELIESTYLMHRASRDDSWLHAAKLALDSIDAYSATDCGYASVLNAATHALDDEMPSFFLAETTKYLYLIFDDDNFVHAEDYVFSTEAHPFSPSRVRQLREERLGKRGAADDDDDDDAAAPGNDDARPVAVAAPAVPAKTAEETAIEIAHMVEIFEALDIGDAAGLTEIQAVKALESYAHLEGEPLEEFRAVVRAAPKDEDGLVAVAALARAVADAEAKPAFAALRATIARAVEVKTSEDASSDEEDLSPRDALNRETQALLHGDGTRSFASAGGGGMQVDLHSGFQFGDTFRLGPPKRRSAGTDGSLFTGHEKMRMDWILVMVLYDRREGGDAMPCHVKKLLKLLKVSGWRRNEDEWRAVVSALAVQGCIRATMSDAGQPYEVFWPSRRDDETKQAVEEAVHAHDADAGAEAKGS